jgi:hypothetical protein
VDHNQMIRLVGNGGSEAATPQHRQLRSRLNGLRAIQTSRARTRPSIGLKAFLRGVVGGAVGGATG